MDEAIIVEPLTSPVDIFPAYFSAPCFDMPEELKTVYYNPTVESKTQSTKQALTSAKLTVDVLEQCSHYWHEQPDAFFASVRTFLESMPNP